QVAPGVIETDLREVGAQQAVNDRVAAGDADRDQVGLELHLPRQAGVGEIDHAEHPAQEPANHIEHRIERVQRLVEPIAAKDDLADDAVGGVDVTSQAHAPLGKVAKLVSEHRFEFRQVQAIDQAEADVQILRDRYEQAPEGARVEDAGVDLRRQHDLRGRRRAGVSADLADECEQARVIGFGDLDALMVVAARELEQALDEVERQQTRGERHEADEPNHEERDTGAVVVEFAQVQEQAAGQATQAAEAGDEREVNEQKQEQTGDDQRGPQPIAERGPGEVGRDAFGIGRIEFGDAGRHERSEESG